MLISTQDHNHIQTKQKQKMTPTQTYSKYQQDSYTNTLKKNETTKQENKKKQTNKCSYHEMLIVEKLNKNVLKIYRVRAGGLFSFSISDAYQP